jgi:hypothetical protein
MDGKMDDRDEDSSFIVSFFATRISMPMEITCHLIMKKAN